MRLAEDGWAVRGTSRSEDGLGAIEEAGIEPAVADPLRPGTVLDLIGDVSVVLWLLGSAGGDPDEVGRMHGERLEHLLLRLVDTPVRGFVYEAEGSVSPEVLREGEALVGRAGATWRIPVGFLRTGPGRHEAWLDEAAGAARAVLMSGR